MIFSQKTGYRFNTFKILMLNVTLSDMQNKSVLSLALATVYRPPGPYAKNLQISSQTYWQGPIGEGGRNVINVIYNCNTHTYMCVCVWCVCVCAYVRVCVCVCVCV